MVIAQLAGGVGNQLFQYAAGRALSLRRGVPLKLDVSAYATDPLERRYRLDRFQIAADVATAEEIRAVQRPRVPAPAAVRRLGASLERRLPYRWRPVLRERHFHFDPDVLGARGRVYLSGYWQSPKYFADIAPLLRRELAFRFPPDAVNERVLGRITAVNAVAIHVRRGDYVSDPRTARLHGVQPVEYYVQAAEHIAKIERDPAFFVFSDDPEWVADHLKLPWPTEYVRHNGPDAECEDLRLMSGCKHHVIANSSFSWWAAWLGEHPGQTVVAPARWFGPDDPRSTVDLIPPAWYRIAA